MSFNNWSKFLKYCSGRSVFNLGYKKNQKTIISRLYSQQHNAVDLVNTNENGQFTHKDRICTFLETQL